jgi:hypothetical protein
MATRCVFSVGWSRPRQRADRRTQARQAASLTLAGLAGFVVACGDSDNPSAPTRYGQPSFAITCNIGGNDPLRCAASVLCPRACAPEVLTGDVTNRAAWESGDPAVVRIVAPGVVEAVGTGDTLVRARWDGYDTSKTISVFDGTPPLPTEEIFGTVYEAGKTPAMGAITGATIEIVGGRLAGRSAESGAPSRLLPGFFGPSGGPGYYRILGVPAGTYRLRVTRQGYVAQERHVTVTYASPVADFVMALQ